jgi:hypothetical protein
MFRSRDIVAPFAALLDLGQWFAVGRIVVSCRANARQIHAANSPSRLPTLPPAPQMGGLPRRTQRRRAAASGNNSPPPIDLNQRRYRVAVVACL